MTDVLHKALKWIDHNRYLVTAIVLSSVLIFGVVGCHSAVVGPVSGKLVGRSQYDQEVLTVVGELEAERQAALSSVEAFNVRAETVQRQIEAGYDELDRQDKIRGEILQTVGGVITEAAQGRLDPVNVATGAMTIAAALLGIGAVADNRRKNAVIERLKTEADTSG